MAVAMGANVIERHITLDNEMEGFDHKVALNPVDLKDFVNKVEKFEITYGNSDLSREITNVEMVTKNKYHVSAISNKKIKSGQIITENDIIFKNPGTGIPPKDIEKIIGKMAKFDIFEDTLLDSKMFD